MGFLTALLSLNINPFRFLIGELWAAWTVMLLQLWPAMVGVWSGSFLTSCVVGWAGHDVPEKHDNPFFGGLANNYIFGGTCFLFWEQVFFLYFSPPARWGLLDFITAVPAPSPSPPPPRPPPSPPPPLPPLPRPLPPCQLFANLFANFPAQWALLDLNCRLPIWVGTAGPQPQGSERSGHRWTSTRDLPSPVGTAGPQPGTFRAQRAPLDLSGQMECQNICQKDCQNICQIDCQNICHIECHIECQNICEKECHIECKYIYIYTR